MSDVRSINNDLDLRLCSRFFKSIITWLPEKAAWRLEVDKTTLKATYWGFFIASERRSTHNFCGCPHIQNSKGEHAQHLLPNYSQNHLVNWNAGKAWHDSNLLLYFQWIKMIPIYMIMGQ